MRFRALALVLALAGCGDDGGAGADAGVADAMTGPDAGPQANWERGIAATTLTVDVSTMQGTAIITLEPSDRPGASFEVGDLTITAVRDRPDSLLATLRDGSVLHVDVPAADAPVDIVIDYGYAIHGGFEGVSAAGYTLTWPYFCGNVFPCHSDPADGMTFALTVTGAGDQVAVYPDLIATEAPSYMLAWAVGDYALIELGTTADGTAIEVWHLPGGEQNALDGTEYLVAAFEWLETTIGPYAFGERAGSVAAPWGFGAYGGMEHHPLWHVGTGAMAGDTVHAHEAAHGWFGNGIRIACWEDFVLSEGTVSYLAARSLRAAAGDAFAESIWDGYAQRLAGVASEIAWPQGCNELDIIEDGLFTSAPYMKGAHFFRALEHRIGQGALDMALAAFYADHVGRAARFQDLLDTIAAETGYDPTACAVAWLRGTSIPSSDTCE
jgi:hypothetical protein